MFKNLKQVGEGNTFHIQLLSQKIETKKKEEQEVWDRIQNIEKEIYESEKNGFCIVTNVFVIEETIKPIWEIFKFLTNTISFKQNQILVFILMLVELNPRLSARLNTIDLELQDFNRFDTREAYTIF